MGGSVQMCDERLFRNLAPLSLYVQLFTATFTGLYFLQCFDTVGWVIWPVKPVRDTTYNVFGGTLNLTQLQLAGKFSASLNFVTLEHVNCHFGVV